MFVFTVDGCHNYTVLSQADRAQGHISSNIYGSDRYNLVPGWYRFQGDAGDRMADKCIPMDHCGSRYPAWLSGAHPTVAEGVVIRRVCFSSYKCCSWYQNIRVKNCGAYFVYALPRLSHSSSRYCGSGSECKFIMMLLFISGKSQNIKLWLGYKFVKATRFYWLEQPKLMVKLTVFFLDKSWLSNHFLWDSWGSSPKIKVCPWRHYWNKNITFRNCGAFFVYKLQKTPFVISVTVLTAPQVICLLCFFECASYQSSIMKYSFKTFSRGDSVPSFRIWGVSYQSDGNSFRYQT